MVLNILVLVSGVIFLSHRIPFNVDTPIEENHLICYFFFAVNLFPFWQVNMKNLFWEDIIWEYIIHPILIVDKTFETEEIQDSGKAYNDMF